MIQIKNYTYDFKEVRKQKLKVVLKKIFGQKIIEFIIKDKQTANKKFTKYEFLYYMLGIDDFNKYKGNLSLDNRLLYKNTLKWE